MSRKTYGKVQKFQEGDRVIGERNGPLHGTVTSWEDLCGKPVGTFGSLPFDMGQVDLNNQDIVPWLDDNGRARWNLSNFLKREGPIQLLLFDLPEK